MKSFLKKSCRYNTDTVSPPGDTLKETMYYITAQDITITVEELESIIDGELEITDEIAEKLSHYCGTKEFWLNRERKYRESIKNE